MFIISKIPVTSSLPDFFQLGHHGNRISYQGWGSGCIQVPSTSCSPPNQSGWKLHNNTILFLKSFLTVGRWFESHSFFPCAKLIWFFTHFRFNQHTHTCIIHPSQFFSQHLCTIVYCIGFPSYSRRLCSKILWMWIAKPQIARAAWVESLKRGKL